MRQAEDHPFLFFENGEMYLQTGMMTEWVQKDPEVPVTQIIVTPANGDLSV